MSKVSAHWVSSACTGGFLSCTLLLLGAVTLLYVALTPIVIWLQGSAGLWSAALAALVSLLAGFSVLAVTHLSSLREKPLVSMLLATALRMIPFLAIGVTLALTRDSREYLDFICYLVLFYIATLAVETYVSVQLAQSHQKSLTTASLTTARAPSTSAREPQA